MEFQRVRMESSILKETREELSMTQLQVADKARIKLRQYQRFENGERNLTSSSFRIACAVLDALQLDITKYARGGYVLADTPMEVEMENPY